MNENAKKSSGLEVNIGELIFVLLRKWWLIALSGILVASMFLAGTKLFVTPKFNSVKMERYPSLCAL